MESIILIAAPWLLGLFFMLAIYKTITASVRSGKERAKWKPQFREGVYEYLQHDDGRRRAVKIENGYSPINIDWLNGVSK